MVKPDFAALHQQQESTELQELRSALAEKEVQLTAALAAARLERKLAEAVLRESDARKAFLLHLNDVLRPVADPIRIQFEAARVLCKHLGADKAYYSGPEGQYPLPSLTEVPATLGNGRPYFVTDTGVSHSLPAETRAAYQALGIRAFACPHRWHRSGLHGRETGLRPAAGAGHGIATSHAQSDSGRALAFG